jgi:hypothetical protein
MSVREDFVEAVQVGRGTRVADRETRPAVEVWPEEDDFGRWVASHTDRARAIVCGSPEFKDAPFCGRGNH